MKITAAVDSVFDMPSLTRCQSDSFRVNKRDDCAVSSRGVTSQLIATAGLNIELTRVNLSDWSSSGPLFLELMKNKSRAYDMILLKSTLMEERIDNGIQFSNVLDPSRLVLITKHTNNTDVLLPNLSIILAQFTGSALIVVITIYVALIMVKLCTKRTFKFEKLITLTLVKTTKLMSMTCLFVFYQAVISQYLLIKTPPDVLTKTLTALDRTANGLAQIYF